jgi:hypothetical protein
MPYKLPEPFSLNNNPLADTSTRDTVSQKTRSRDGYRIRGSTCLPAKMVMMSPALRDVHRERLPTAAELCHSPDGPT